MNIHLFLYDKFADFEISQALLLLRDHNLTTVGFETGLVNAISNLFVDAEISIEEFEPNRTDIFIIPGGEPKNFIRDEKYSEKIINLNKKLIEMKNQGKIVAAICGGPTFLANAGALDYVTCTSSKNEDENIFYEKAKFTDSDLEIDNNIITAKGNAFTEFAVAIAKKARILKTDKEAQEAIDWLRNKK